jgi:hypothetical protein
MGTGARAKEASDRRTPHAARRYGGMAVWRHVARDLRGLAVVSPAEDRGGQRAANGRSHRAITQGDHGGVMAGARDMLATLDWHTAKPVMVAPNNISTLYSLGPRTAGIPLVGFVGFRGNCWKAVQSWSAASSRTSSSRVRHQF